jgi:hypothetical protein
VTRATSQFHLKRDSGEYKLMGLAASGKPVHRDRIQRRLLDLKSESVMTTEPANAWEKAIHDQPRGGFSREIWEFVWLNKKWWLMPVLLVLLLFGVLVLLSSSGTAPFIYTLF